MTSKKTPVHSFDVYGVLLDDKSMGVQIMDLFREVAEGKLSGDEITRRVTDYQSLIDKNPEALQEKPRILEEVYTYALDRGATVDPSKALYEDTLHTLVEILDQRQQVVILGSKAFDTACLPEEISSRMLGSYAGPKTDPDTFRELAGKIGESHELVSHSEDGLIELRAAAEAGLQRENLVYVARDSSNIKDALSEGFTVSRELNANQYIGMRD
jgi:FMN phosphatase YigB (HAD superfamily)